MIIEAPYVEQEQRFNSAIALLTNGKRYRYHKINLTSSETAYFDSGTQTLTFQSKDVSYIWRFNLQGSERRDTRS